MLQKRQQNGESYDLYIDLHRDAYSKGNGPNTVDTPSGASARLLMLIGKGRLARAMISSPTGKATVPLLKP